MKIDAVISDVVMPEMDGYEFYLHVKQEMPQIPVVLMTAYYYDKDHIIKRSKLKGLEGAIFKKPVNPGKLRQMLISMRQKDAAPPKPPIPPTPDRAPRAARPASVASTSTCARRAGSRSEKSRARRESLARASPRPAYPDPRIRSRAHRGDRAAHRAQAAADSRALRAVLLPGRHRRRLQERAARLHAAGARKARTPIYELQFGDASHRGGHPRVGAPMGAAVLESLIATRMPQVHRMRRRRRAGAQSGPRSSRRPDLGDPR